VNNKVALFRTSCQFFYSLYRKWILLFCRSTINRFYCFTFDFV